jgi:class 3 adenylate cyclase
MLVFDEPTTVCPSDGRPLFSLLSPTASPTIRSASNNYQLERLIGVGGTGEVFEASATKGPASKVAIKILRAELCEDESRLGDFISDLNRLNQQRHSNIVEGYAVGALRDGRQYWVMELLTGSTLGHWLAVRGLPSIEDTLAVLRGIAAALDVAHGLGIVHRMLKPSNIFLTKDADNRPHPKLIDFGLGRLSSVSHVNTDAATIRASMGALHYLSPEHCAGRPLDKRSDYYSFGVIAFELLTGMRPLDTITNNMLIAKLDKPPAPPSAIRASLPQAVDDLVLALLDPEPGRRPQSLSRVIDQLEIVLHPTNPSDPATDEESDDLDTLLDRDTQLDSHDSDASIFLPLPVKPKPATAASMVTAPMPALSRQLASAAAAGATRSGGSLPVRTPPPPVTRSGASRLKSSVRPSQEPTKPTEPVPEPRRKLVAILAADAVGYSALMEQDDVAALRTLNVHRENMAEIVENHEGRVVDFAGDSMLAEFSSTLQAFRCALRAQEAIDEHNRELPEHEVMRFRMGIHIGDVVVAGERIYGDGVNIASRLQALAQPGGICVSGSVHEQVRLKVRIAFRDLGEQNLKNLMNSVHAFHVDPEAITGD